jgi:hypothetical protein
MLSDKGLQVSKPDPVSGLFVDHIDDAVDERLQLKGVEGAEVGQLGLVDGLVVLGGGHAWLVVGLAALQAAVEHHPQRKHLALDSGLLTLVQSLWWHVLESAHMAVLLTDCLGQSEIGQLKMPALAQNVRGLDVQVQQPVLEQGAAGLHHFVKKAPDLPLVQPGLLLQQLLEAALALLHDQVAIMLRNYVIELGADQVGAVSLAQCLEGIDLLGHHYLARV